MFLLLLLVSEIQFVFALPVHATMSSMLQSNGVNRSSTPFYAAQPEVSITLLKMLVNMRLSEFVSSMTPQVETS